MLFPAYRLIFYLPLQDLFRGLQRFLLTRATSQNLRLREILATAVNECNSRSVFRLVLLLPTFRSLEAGRILCAANVYFANWNRTLTLELRCLYGQS